ncbi:tetratricopeptide repeat protein [Capilliphycus salinus ALCB114379]|uniref:tetratricopeptide repeat protein n=1 Tax=Capilliphycus salinus TaxID=2768948 RepID=UPI0039A51954
MAIRLLFWRVRQQIDPTPNQLTFGGWMILLSIIFFPSLSFATPISVLSLQPTGTPVAQIPISTEQQDRENLIEAEVDRAFRRKLSTVNLLLILLLVLPTLAAGGVWFLLSKLTQQTVLAQQEIASLKADALSQLEIILSEAQTILSDLQQQNIEVERRLESLKSQSNLQFPQQVSPDSPQNLKLAQDYAKQGDKFFTQGCYDEAVEAYDRALQLDSHGVEVWNNRGVVLTKLHRYHEAIASYEQALQLRSEYADAWNNRGVALGKLKYYEAAVLSYDRAINLRENYVDAWNNRGFALAQLKRYEEAIDSYQKAAELNPDFYLVWYNQARCYGMQDKLDLALENLERAMNIKPAVVRNLAKKETDFESLVRDERFQSLIQNQS